MAEDFLFLQIASATGDSLDSVYNMQEKERNELIQVLGLADLQEQQQNETKQSTKKSTRNKRTKTFNYDSDEDFQLDFKKGKLSTSHHDAETKNILKLSGPKKKRFTLFEPTSDDNRQRDDQHSKLNADSDAEIRLKSEHKVIQVDASLNEDSNPMPVECKQSLIARTNGNVVNAENLNNRLIKVNALLLSRLELPITEKEKFEQIINNTFKLDPYSDHTFDIQKFPCLKSETLEKIKGINPIDDVSKTLSNLRKYFEHQKHCKSIGVYHQVNKKQIIHNKWFPIKTVNKASLNNTYNTSQNSEQSLSNIEEYKRLNLKCTVEVEKLKNFKYESKGPLNTLDTWLLKPSSSKGTGRGSKGKSKKGLKGNGKYKLNLENTDIEESIYEDSITTEQPQSPFLSLEDVDPSIADNDVGNGQLLSGKNYPKSSDVLGLGTFQKESTSSPQTEDFTCEMCGKIFNFSLLSVHLEICNGSYQNITSEKNSLKRKIKAAMAYMDGLESRSK